MPPNPPATGCGTGDSGERCQLAEQPCAGHPKEPWSHHSRCDHHSLAVAERQELATIQSWDAGERYQQESQSCAENPHGYQAGFLATAGRVICPGIQCTRNHLLVAIQRESAYKSIHPTQHRSRQLKPTTEAHYRLHCTHPSPESMADASSDLHPPLAAPQCSCRSPWSPQSSPLPSRALPSGVDHSPARTRQPAWAPPGADRAGAHNQRKPPPLVAAACKPKRHLRHIARWTQRS